MTVDRLLEPREQLEDLTPSISGYAHAVVGHLYPPPVGEGLSADGDARGDRGSREFHCVGQQVEHDGVQLTGIRADHGQVVHPYLGPDAPQGGGEVLQRSLDDDAQVGVASA